MRSSITFCATGKTGIGHLRRLTNIAVEVRRLQSTASLRLVCNAYPGGLTPSEISLYGQIDQVPRTEMADALRGHRGGTVVVDTAVIPGLHTLDIPLCLVLRQTVNDKLAQFRLEEDKLWDLVLLPNPAGDWRPALDVLKAKTAVQVGWIFRPPATGPQENFSFHRISEKKRRVVLIATGGGGNAQTAQFLRSELEPVLERLAWFSPPDYQIIQVLGPRAHADLRLPQADHIIDAGPHLNMLFSQADLVISTAGYNSVLELARTDVPTLLVPIHRTIDDQYSRSRCWAGRLGEYHECGNADKSARWIATSLSSGERRPAIDLGESGARRAAELILELG